MKIWLDATTGKHVRYVYAISERLRKRGHITILTTRYHPDTIPLAKMLGANFEVVGKYDPSSLASRLKSSLERQAYLLKRFRDDKPDLFISNQSPDGCRVAFSLGIPIITTADTPYADKVNRLTIPLTDTLITSVAIPSRFYKKYSPKKIVHFNGVDEVAWMKDFRQKGWFNPEFAVVRLAETKASYALNMKDFAERVSLSLTFKGKVLVFPRFIVPYVIDNNETYPLDEYVDSLELVSKTGLFVGIGGTMSRETALFGIPSVVLGDFEQYVGIPLHVNHYVRKLGFPLMFAYSEEELMQLAKEYFGKRFPVYSLLQKLENPLDVIEKEVDKFESA